MKKTLLTSVALAALMIATPAFAACGPAFSDPVKNAKFISNFGANWCNPGTLVPGTGGGGGIAVAPVVVTPETPVVTPPTDPVVTPPTDPVVTPPTDPTDPTDPVDPPDEEPTDPTDPVDPPTDPEDPTDPVDPPDEPTDPTDPVDPPTDPEDPTDPVDPPDEPTDPVDPVDPPDEPTDPVDPPTSVPSTPLTPATPTPGTITGNISETPYAGAAPGVYENIHLPAGTYGGVYFEGGLVNGYVRPDGTFAARPVPVVQPEPVTEVPSTPMTPAQPNPGVVSGVLPAQFFAEVLKKANNAGEFNNFKVDQTVTLPDGTVIAAGSYNGRIALDGSNRFVAAPKK